MLLAQCVYLQTEDSDRSGSVDSGVGSLGCVYGSVPRPARRRFAAGHSFRRSAAAGQCRRQSGPARGYQPAQRGLARTLGPTRHRMPRLG